MSSIDLQHYMKLSVIDSCFQQIKALFKLYTVFGSWIIRSMGGRNAPTEVCDDRVNFYLRFYQCLWQRWSKFEIWTRVLRKINSPNSGWIKGRSLTFETFIIGQSLLGLGIGLATPKCTRNSGILWGTGLGPNHLCLFWGPQTHPGVDLKLKSAPTMSVSM